MQGNGATRSELARAVVCALGLVTAATISSPAAAVDRIATDVIAAITMNKSKDSDNGGHL